VGASNDGHLVDLHPHPSMKSLEQQVFRRATCFVVALLLLFQSAGAVAPGPASWSQKEVLDPDAGADDFAAANIGQLKFMASRAAEALDQAEAAAQRPLTTLQTEAKIAIGSMIASWNELPEAGVTRDDFHALNTGQLKHVAGLFYQRLGLPLPWAAGSPGADDFRMVNVGQLKQAFSFELRVARGGPPMAVPDAVLQAAHTAWSVLSSTQRAAGSTADDFDGDGISNLQEYLMQPGLPLFDLNDKDGDGIADSIETASGGILNPLVFSDAVEDDDGDGVMNYEEVRLGLSLTTDVTPGRGDGLTDAEVLAWGLLAGVPLAPSTDAIRACWEVIDEEWIEQQGGMAFYGHWLVRTLDNNNQPAGWTAFQTEFSGPWNPDAWFIENPPPAIDLDGDEIPDMDRDADGLPDVWEFRYQLNPRDDDDNMEDPDGDTLTNLVEFANRTHPRLADSDGDGFSDIEEQAHGSDPLLGGSVPPVVLQLTGKSAHQHYPGEITPPLAVRATQAGIVRMGAEITFTLMTGGGTLSPASQNGASAATTLTVTTGADGVAAITYTAAGQPEKAIVLATVPGGAAFTAFTVQVIAVPEEFSGAGTGGGRLGGTGGGQVGGIASVLPAASRLFEALLAGSDGMFLRYATKLDKEKPFPKVDEPGWVYLGPGQKLDPVSSGGYSTIDQSDPTKGGVSHHKRIVFEGATRPCSRTYLVLFFQDERVTPSLSSIMGLQPALAVKSGTLTFSAQDHNTREITINGSIPQEYMKQIKDTNGNPAVDFLGPAPTSKDERFWMVLLPIDLAVDSNNDGTINGGDTAVEDVESGGSIDKMGHHLQVNTFDYDADKVPDYIDGITKGGSLLASAGGNSIAGDPQRHFSKLKMTLGFSRSEYDFMFEYSADNPNNLSVSQGSNFGQKEHVGGAVENYNISAPGGSLRIWTKDADTSRKAESITASTAGDFVPANEWIAGDKMPTGDMFLEGVRPSTGWGSDKIKLKARNKTSTGTVIDLDSVSLTVSKSVLRVYVNRPYTYEAAATVKRPQLEIDYSTPRNANTSLFNAMHPTRHDGIKRPFARGDDNWYGHGFWCASYSGPGDTSIMTANETGPDGAKEYWSGKTNGPGGSTSAQHTALKEGKVFWFIEPGLQHGRLSTVDTYQTAASPSIRTPAGEDMKIIAWHDFILPPKMLQKICTYPGRHDFSKYGLDIGATEGGCASYVGLTLKDAGMSEHLKWEVRNHLITTHSVSNEFPVVVIPGWDWFWAWSISAVIELARDNFIATPGTDTWGGYTPAWQLNFYDPGLLAKWMDDLRCTNKRTSTIYTKMPTP